MNKNRLLKNIMDQIKEAQIKLGYDRETMRLYYPVDSLNKLLATKCENITEMLSALQQHFKEATDLGTLTFTIRGGRIEVCIPPEGSEYVHTDVEAPAFLIDLIGLFQKNHHCTLEAIREVFAKYSTAYICDKMPEDGEFDYVMYFKDPIIDEYYYCIKMEMGHTIYHRFTKEDYELLMAE